MVGLQRNNNSSFYCAFVLNQNISLEQNDLLEKKYSIMQKVNANVFLNEPPIMWYMINHVLSH
jgi:hypothetical protein